MITIENRDDYITMTRLLRKSRTDCIRVKIMGNEYLWVKNSFTKDSSMSIHELHMNACMFIHGCAVVARIMPSIKNEELNDARKFAESTRTLANIMKGGK